VFIVSFYQLVYIYTTVTLSTTADKVALTFPIKNVLTNIVCLPIL